MIRVQVQIYIDHKNTQTVCIYIRQHMYIYKPIGICFVQCTSYDIPSATLDGLGMMMPVHRSHHTNKENNQTRSIEMIHLPLFYLKPSSTAANPQLQGNTYTVNTCLACVCARLSSHTIHHRVGLFVIHDYHRTCMYHGYPDLKSI